MFKKGLWSDVKALFVTLTGSNMPTTIDAYIAQAITFNNSLHAQAQELKVKRDSLATLLPVPSQVSTVAPSAPRPAAPTDPVPMEVDAICHRGPVSPQERQRRRDQGLCAYCGGKHKIDDCKALAKHNANGGKKSSPGSSQQGKAKPEAH
ncbi:hypothetical protein FOMPIDRAFT_93654 [Fomitopsis schrenkii]|uniref:Retrotransposon gag domain-containing protein n=1 Tax=Fomitopsis schrenkii TaxID=2126942 RepID=S8DW30_FOMSC|nr:hypothetical protein FOMPIDRAFT_93654 [Fomitopsis schrenkii]